MIRYRIPLLAFVVSHLSGCWSIAQVTDEPAAPAQLSSGDAVTVTEIVKGDELKVSKDGSPATLRLLGVLAFDTEIQDPALASWRQASLDFLGERVLDKSVTVTLGKTKKDAHGRYLAYVERAEGETAVDVNREMIVEGLSMVYTEYGFEREADYLAVEAQARAAKKNLWGQQQPVDVIKGLRAQWARFRAQRGGAPTPDPLLTPTSGEAPTPAGKEK